MTTCQGTWRDRPVEFEGDPISVLRCDGCGEKQVIIGYRGYGPYEPDLSDEDVIRLAFTERALAASRRRAV